MRAITEAAQSRLSYIHGARDDLVNRANFFALRGHDAERIETFRMRERV